MRNLYILLTLLLFACEDEWLEVKQNKEQVVPQKLNELQALLDNTSIMNFNSSALGEMGSDDIYLTPDRWETRSPKAKNSYIWAADIYEGEDVFDWDVHYERLLYANTVLEGLENIDASQEKEYVKGRALFHRAWNHFHLAQIFSKQYDKSTSATDLGIPLRHTSNINAGISRNTIEETYSSVIADIAGAIGLLPEIADIKTRPDKAAAYGFLARVYLQIEEYEKALENAEKSLKIHNQLVDYNTVNVVGSYPLQDNEEVIYQNMVARNSPIGNYSYLYVSEELYQSYSENDLRKAAFLSKADGSGFKGSYSMTTQHFFNGIATNELYMILAECHARVGDIDAAKDALNKVLVNRYVTGKYEPVSTINREELLTIILQERRKELVFRGLRWMDLKRLNKDPRFAKTLNRNINGVPYELAPNSPRYVYPIPDIVVEMSGVIQNVR